MFSKTLSFLYSRNVSEIIITIITVKLRVKVKLTLEQTTKDRWGRRGKAVFFLNLLKPYWLRDAPSV